MRAAAVINSAISNSNNTNLNSVDPVALMPINALLPYMQKFCDDFQNNSNKSDSSSHMLNRFFCQQQQQHQSRNSSPQSQQIEIDVNSLNFSYIAEGCRDTRSFQIKEFFHQQQSYILIEINESSLKIKNCSNENETRFKLSKIFSLSNREHKRSRFIKLETLNGRPHEINFHIDNQN